MKKQFLAIVLSVAMVLGSGECVFALDSADDEIIEEISISEDVQDEEISLEECVEEEPTIEESIGVEEIVEEQEGYTFKEIFGDDEVLCDYMSEYWYAGDWDAEIGGYRIISLDPDNDGYITDEDIALFKELNIDEYNEPINGVTDWGSLEKLTALEEIQLCNMHSIENIKLPGSIKYFSCPRSVVKLNTLDLSKCLGIKEIYLNSVKFEGENKTLQSFLYGADSCEGIDTIDISNTNLTSANVNIKSNGMCFRARYCNELTEVNLNDAFVRWFEAYDSPKLKTVNIKGFGTEGQIDLERCSSLDNISIDWKFDITADPDDEQVLDIYASVIDTDSGTFLINVTDKDECNGKANIRCDYEKWIHDQIKDLNIFDSIEARKPTAINFRKNKKWDKDGDEFDLLVGEKVENDDYYFKYNGFDVSVKKSDISAVVSDGGVVSYDKDTKTITALKPGDATITIKYKDIQAVRKVHVRDKVSSVNLTPDGSKTVYLMSPGTTTFTAKLTPSDNVIKDVWWKINSSDAALSNPTGAGLTVKKSVSKSGEPTAVVTAGKNLEGKTFKLNASSMSNYKVGSTTEKIADECTVTIVKGYSIKYVLDGGTNHPDNPSQYAKESDTITLKAPTRNNYFFDGWFNGDKEVTQIVSGSTGDITLTAKWRSTPTPTPKPVKDIKYTVTFDGNKATKGSMKKLSCKTNKDYTLKANAFKRTGYTFDSWNTKANGKGKKIENKGVIRNLTTKNNATVTLYAQWKVNKYSISYKLNEGTNNTKNPKSYTVSSKTITLKDAKKTGYNFDGWYTSSKYKKKVTEIEKGSTGNKTLYAKWKPIKYTVRFNPNGGKGNVKEQTLTYDKKGKLSANKFTRKGYKFLGWSTKKKAKEPDYSNKESVLNLAQKDGKVINLYAVWQKNSKKSSK